MHSHTLKSNLILLLTAAIWGLAFVAQRVGMAYIGAFTYNGIRFALGSLSLIPLILFYSKKNTPSSHKKNTKQTLLAGIICGIFLFLGASFQQVGLIGTTAGKAAFITGLYIVLVPIVGLFLKQHMSLSSWIGTLIAMIGLYILCVNENLTISSYDILELFSALFFTFHILVIDYFSVKVDALKLAATQFLTCSILSLMVALVREDIYLEGILQAVVPILYGGIFSVGIAYTLQIIGQKNVKPSHAAIIMSMESVFAALGGFFLLGEVLSNRNLVGCLCMFVGMILCQLKFKPDSN